jgi:UDP-N-acetylmuramate dehydrogenase
MLDIKQNESLAKYTTFRLGGAAKFFVEAKTPDELREAFAWAAENKRKYFVLGGGSNLLFSDAGFDGLVIKFSFNEIAINGDEVTVGGGMPLFLVIKKTADAGLAGMESLAGIPGTVGGAAANNAGAYGTTIGDVFHSAELLFPDGRAATVDRDWMQYAYRASRLKFWNDGGKPVLTKITLKLKKSEPEILNEKIKEIFIGRSKTPKGFCAGCAFKNIKGEAVADMLEKHDFTPDEKNIFAARKAIPAAWFVEKMDLKGKKIGGAYVASEHANYIMNDGTGRADDVIALISYIKQQVRDKFGVQLEEEVEMVL